MGTLLIHEQCVRILGDQVCHRTNKYLNNCLEQDHRGIKQRYYHMHGFGCFDSAARFCSAFDELRNYLRPRSTMGETASPDISGDKSSLIGLLLMTGSDASSLKAERELYLRSGSFPW
jgi:hypothetical protein